MSVSAILLAAGRGERMGAAAPKAFLALAGRPLFMHSLEKFARVAQEVVLVVPEERVDEAAKIAGAGVVVTAGGAERQDSVERGLARLRLQGVVAVHDTARALVSAATIERVIAAAPAIAAVPASDTLKRVGPGGAILNTLDRSEIWQAQTPQAFPVAMLRRAFERARSTAHRGTDCSSLVEELGERVRVVPPEGPNFKITTPEDLLLAEALLRR
jgi:2-C-methyl-D-erythritol 4-phosphate cytidylyltransferase